jgi:hypothetical protein
VGSSLQSQKHPSQINSTDAGIHTDCNDEQLESAIAQTFVILDQQSNVIAVLIKKFDAANRMRNNTAWLIGMPRSIGEKQPNIE